ncbi:hypothetical protein OIU85_006246 [Salix viminalis]|uniref:Uncharacterized protein n=1 Tax=Salix viminalis TaxID=40686 RepID=A0A9Q0PKR8_SALVM|nr:hypothetical protein OIU85_006246 [Salix viminalis]
MAGVYLGSAEVLCQWIFKSESLKVRILNLENYVLFPVRTSSKGESAEASQGEIFWTGKLRIASKCQRKSSILQRKN